MRPEVIFHLRDADGLDIYAYSFLLTVESRGFLRTARERTWSDMRMGKDRYYKALKLLEAEGLIEIRERRSLYQKLPIEITVNKSAVMRLPRRPDGEVDTEEPSSSASKKRSKSKTADKATTKTSLEQTSSSVARTSSSAIPDQKKRLKTKTKSSKMKEEPRRKAKAK